MLSLSRVSLLSGLFLLLQSPAWTADNGDQIDIPRIELMPNIPNPLFLLDWKQKARDYDDFVFDPTLTGEHLPAIWTDTTRINFPRDGFGMPAYIGHFGQTGGANHEAIATMGSVLGSTFAGIDKSDQDGMDYVLMVQNYYNTANSENLVLNRVSARSGRTFWYEIWPHILFYSLAYHYPGFGTSNNIVFTTANKWYAAAGTMGGYTGSPNFNHTAFSFEDNQPFNNDRWREPDAAAGIAWLQYMAYQRFGSPQFLTGAKWGLQYLEETDDNPNYEIMLSYGAYTAARMNAEFDTEYDVGKLVDWVFEPSSTVRRGWGCIVGTWNGHEVNGLLGSTTNRGGYAFSFVTFANMASLVPLVRYDDRFARAIGKWMLNASVTSRLYYADQLPAENQSSAFWGGDPGAAIAYEGLRFEWEGVSPFATGDALRNDWAATDFALYGGGYVGILGAIVDRTNEPAILQLDLLATDIFPDAAYPSYLYYNPHSSDRTVEINVGSQPVDLYDAVTSQFVGRDRTGETTFTVAGDSAVILVLPPHGGRLSADGKRLLVDGVVIDYHNRSDIVTPRSDWMILTY